MESSVQQAGILDDPFFLVGKKFEVLGMTGSALTAPRTRACLLQNPFLRLPWETSLFAFLPEHPGFRLRAPLVGPLQMDSI